MEDSNRAAVRRRTLKEGKIVLSDWSVIDCRIRNMSDTGARVEFDGPTSLPADFRLLVISSNQLTPAALVWQRGLAAGIHFTGPSQDAPPRKF